MPRITPAADEYKYISARMQQIEAERHQARNPVDEITTQNRFRHPKIINSEYWNIGDSKATEAWFDDHTDRPMDAYLSHCKRLPLSKLKMAARDPYRAEAVVENTITLVARMILVGLL